MLNRSLRYGARVPDAEQQALEQLLELGTEVAGGTAGAAIGLIGGPAGAIAGAAAGPVVGRALLHLVREIKSRLLGHREEVRIGAAIAYALDTIRERMARGDQVRRDGFFADTGTDRSDAEEVLEGVLLVAQREHEERKLEFLGRLLGNLAFEPDVDRASANYLVRLAQELSYRQYVLLGVFAGAMRYVGRPASELDLEERTLLSELNPLCTNQRGLIGPEVVFETSTGGFYPLENVDQVLDLRRDGRLLHRLLELRRLPRDDVQRVRVLLLGED